MIIVFCPMRQNDIIKEIEDFEINNIKQFSLIKKNGIKLVFDSKVNDNSEACNIINGIIRNYKYASALMFNVVPCENDEIKWF